MSDIGYRIDPFATINNIKNLPKPTVQERRDFERVTNVKTWSSFAIKHGKVRLFERSNHHEDWMRIIDFVLMMSLPLKLWASLPESDRILGVACLYSNYVWAKGPTYWLTPEICDLIHKSNCPKDISGLKFPAPNFMLVPPKGGLVNPNGNSISYILVSSGTVSDEDGFIGISFCLDEESLYHHNHSLSGLGEIEDSYFSISENFSESEINDMDVDAEKRFTDQVSAFIGKMLFYFNTPSPDIEREYVSKRIKYRRFVKGKTDVWSPNFIGKNTRWSHNDAISDRASPRAHLVRGHFHRYWIGPKDNKSLSIKWIKPYWKGAEQAAKEKAA